MIANARISLTGTISTVGLREEIRKIYRQETQQYYKTVKSRSPGKLATAWAWSDRSSDELVFEVSNGLPWANWGIRGRGPGKMPPIDSVRAWSEKRGIPPYLVARKIGKVGTERWRQGRNWVGITREDKVDPDGLIQKTNQEILRRIEKIQ